MLFVKNVLKLGLVLACACTLASCQGTPKCSSADVQATLKDIIAKQIVVPDGPFPDSVANDIQITNIRPEHYDENIRKTSCQATLKVPMPEKLQSDLNEAGFTGDIRYTAQVTDDSGTLVDLQDTQDMRLLIGVANVPAPKPPSMADAVTQYPAGIRTAILHNMIVSNGTLAEQLRFNKPDEFSFLSSASVGVFSPSGGGATYQAAPPEVMANNSPGTWNFNMDLAIARLGTDEPDIVAYLPGVSLPVCQKIDTQLGIAPIPEVTTDLSPFYLRRMVTLQDHDYVAPTKPVPVLGGTGIDGQPFACFKSVPLNMYVYYYVLVER